MTWSAYHAKGVRMRCAEGRVRVAATIDERVFERIRDAAVQKRVSLSHEISAALSAYAQTLETETK